MRLFISQLFLDCKIVNKYIDNLFFPRKLFKLFHERQFIYPLKQVFLGKIAVLQGVYTTIRV